MEDKTGWWDLWMFWSDDASYEVLPKQDCCTIVREYRVYERIKKSRIWMVGSRKRTVRKHRSR
jgi:hypothetical protein